MVVGGSVGGRRLRVAARPGLRPTGDRARESLFNVLGGLDGLRVLDLFAGSGTLGIEALSRSAASAIFVERDRVTASVLWDNLVRCELEQSAELLVCDQRAARRRLRNGRHSFDLLFLDPPYKWRNYEGLLMGLCDDGLVSHRARVIVEHASGLELAALASWEVLHELVFVNSTILILEVGVESGSGPAVQ